MNLQQILFWGCASGDAYKTIEWAHERLCEGDQEAKNELLIEENLTCE